MFTNYLKVAFRAMLKHKGYTFINVFGLTVSMAACLLIFLWVRDELSYDRFNNKAERIYRVSWHARFGDNEWNIPLIPVPVGETLLKEFPEVEETVRFKPGGFTVRLGGEFVRETRVLFVEESFFNVFTVHFVDGSPTDALRDPDAVVLTSETARRYFPGQNPVGKTIERNDGKLMRVTAVVESFPSQSHVHFDILAPLKSLPIFDQRRTQWASATVYTYAVLKPGKEIQTLQTRLQQYVEKNVAGDEFRKSGNYTSFPMAPLLDLHLRSHLQYELESNGEITYVYIFSLIGCFILLLACINFINLSTARSMKRANEVAIRKVLGSTRAQLVRQFLSESFFHVVLAIFGAIAVAEIAAPSFSHMAGKQIEIGILDSPAAVAMLVGLAAVVTLLAGAYPAVVLSSFWPAVALRGGAAHFGRDRMRKILVVLQFCISIGLIVCTLVVHNQLQFIQSARLGFDREQVLVIHKASALGDRHLAFKARLRQATAVADAAAAQFLPGDIFDSTVFSLEQPANYEYTSLTYDLIDEHLADVLKFNIVAGRNFSLSYASDSTAFLVNEAAVKAIGWKNPLGKQINMGDQYKGAVIGVVADFNFESLHNEVKPMVLLYNKWSPSNIAVRLRPGNITQAVTAIRDLWKEIAPNSPFEYSFLDADYQSLYQNEERVAEVFSTFSVLAIVIACLGLFGLASYTAEQRTKEIGVRKVLGASEFSIIRLLTREFVGLILVAIVVSVPLSYFLMNRWLQNFAYRTEIGWWVFALSGGLALGVALLTVSYQSLKVALSNPVDALRYE